MKKKTLKFLVGGGVAFGVLAVLTQVKDSLGRPLLDLSRSLTPGDYEFPFDDAQRLLGGQKNGGLVHVPAGATASSPILVWLHGNNEEGVMRRGVGAPGNDLRKMVPPGMIVAAPSQTKNGKGASLWAGFNLDRFLDGVEAALGTKLDRGNVILAGHSGAGCAGNSGVYAPFGVTIPRMLLIIDCCMDEAFGRRVRDLGKLTTVKVFFQRGTWSRDFNGFIRALGLGAEVEEIKSFPSGYGSPHEAIVPVAISRAFGMTPVA